MLTNIELQFLKAAEKGHIEKIKELYKKSDHSLIEARNSTGATAIHLAAREGHNDIIDYLLSLGQNIDSTDF
jgi:ankyrin repeat protein